MNCEQYYHDPKVLNALQVVRRDVDRPLIINSAHRCALHNARSGGAPFSQHLKIAVDIDMSARGPYPNVKNLRHSQSP